MVRIIIFFLFSLVGCQSEPIGIKVHIYNASKEHKTLHFYVLQEKILSLVSVDAYQIKTVFVPSIAIISAIEKQEYSTGNLKIVNENKNEVFDICGYIVIATSEVCGKHDFYIDI